MAAMMAIALLLTACEDDEPTAADGTLEHNLTTICDREPTPGFCPDSPWQLPEKTDFADLKDIADLTGKAYDLLDDLQAGSSRVTDPDRFEAGVLTTTEAELARLRSTSELLPSLGVHLEPTGTSVAVRVGTDVPAVQRIPVCRVRFRGRWPLLLCHLR
jgi:hypothetical protein